MSYEKGLAEALHREDTLGRAIHEDHFAMQVPSYGADVCTACRHEAPKLIAALAERGIRLVSEDSLDAAWAEAEAAMVRHHGAAVTVGGTGRGDYYAHIVTPPPFPEHGEYGSTPTAALRALAARLSEGSGS